jgi:ribonuclease BN (tRNA processing enzyme)
MVAAQSSLLFRMFAYGFVFEAGGRKLAFSGDTAYCPAFIEAARGADVLVHECFIHDATGLYSV